MRMRLMNLMNFMIYTFQIFVPLDPCSAGRLCEERKRFGHFDEQF